MNSPDEPPGAAPSSPDLPEFSRLLRGDVKGFAGAIDWRIFWPLLPLVVFFALNSTWPEDLRRTQVAIAVSFLASVWVFLNNRDSGIIRLLAVLVFGVVTVSAIVGFAANSDKAFVSQNISTDFLMVAISLGSVIIGKPLVGAVARQAVPALRDLMEPTHRVFVYLTLTFMALNLGTGVFRIFLLGEFSANEYIWVSRITTPLSIAFFAACYFAIKRTAGVAVRLHGL